MKDALWICQLAAGLATLIGFAWLSLAMDDHWQQVHGGTTPAQKVRTILRTLGVASLITSAALCFVVDRPTMAVLVWLMLLAGSAPLIAVTLAFRPRLLRLVWPWGDRATRAH